MSNIESEDLDEDYELEVDPVAQKGKLYDYYFELHDKYTKIYGNKTLVFIQLGKFYDAYCTNTKGYVNLRDLEALLHIKFIDRDSIKYKKLGSKCTKPNQFGINYVAILRYLSIMLDNGFTVVLFDQVVPDYKDDDDNEDNDDNDDNGDNEKNVIIERKCIGVYSPGTYISDVKTDDSNYILSVYIAEEKQIGFNNLLAIGITLIDITTGKNTVHEFYSNKNDEKFGLDELVRIMRMFNPVEMVFYYNSLSDDDAGINYVKLYLDLNKKKNIYFFVYHNKVGNDRLKLLNENVFKLEYQNEYLATVFGLNHQLKLHKKTSPLEILNLEKQSYATVSLIIILKYIAEHNNNLLKNLLFPETYLYNMHLILGNNAIDQLNIINSNNLESYNSSIESLFDVINKTSTPMGKRYLKENLTNPLSQKNKKLILQRYNLIDSLLENKLYKIIKNELKKINDIEKFHRKMALGIIPPFQFYRLDTYYHAILGIVITLKDVPLLQDILPAETIKDFQLLQDKYNKEFDFDILKNYSNIDDINYSIFNKGINVKIDKLQSRINYIKSLVSSINSYFTKLISTKCKKSQSDLFLTCNNEKDGYYFTITKTNEKILQAELKKLKSSITITLSANEKCVIEKNQIVFKPLQKGRTKIFIDSLTEQSGNLQPLEKELSRLIKKKYQQSVLKLYAENKTTMYQISTYVAYIDFLVSGAIVADLNYYCKPKIASDKNIASFIQAKNLRHAIIEKLNTEIEYVPNDIELGNVPDCGSDSASGKNGILLYGINSTGKSSIMKSVGIAVILAQIGYYVPAEEFSYEPYMALYARITGNDNIFKGLSSFSLEMSELDAILTRTENQGNNTMVIGDEVCRGTEDISGRAIVASALVSLSKCLSTFIFSSHLHDIPNIEEIKKLDNLRIFYLRAEYDQDNNCIIFDRKMIPGSGPPVYGLLIAKYLIKNPNFIKQAETIKMRLLGEEKIDIPVKSNPYNKDLVTNKCQLCGYKPQTTIHKELERHHIHFQMNCLTDGKIKDKPYLHKNRLSNLVVLCRPCHVKVHKNEITIKGYLDTTIGPMLDYHTDINKKISVHLDKIEILDKKYGHLSKSAHFENRV